MPGWPDAPGDPPCDYAGRLRLLPAMTQVGLPDLVPSRVPLRPGTGHRGSRSGRCRWPSAPASRGPHAGTLADDEGLAFALGLTSLPKATDLGTDSCGAPRVDENPPTELLQALRPLGLAIGQQGSTATSTPSATTATRPSWKSNTSPDAPSAPAPSTFSAEDHATSDMVYFNADITKAEQAAEIIAFAVTGTMPPAANRAGWSSTSS